MDLPLTVFLWVCLCGYLEGSPAVGVVGGMVNMNMTITDRNVNVPRYLNDPNDVILLEFFPGQANPSDPTPDVTYTGNVSEGFVSFTLSNVRKESAGIYQYLVSNIIVGSVVAGEQILVIAERPSTPVITELSQQAVAGRAYRLNCSAVSRSEKPGHNLIMFSEWKRNGANIMADAKYGVNGTILTIINLNRTDNNDRLTCIAFEVELKKSPESNVFPLNVHYGPDNLQITPAGNLTVDEGRNVSIECSAECNPRCDSYKWQNSSDNSSVGFSQSLVIVQIKREHTGVYICNITNMAISKSATTPINIIVNYPPSVNINSRNGSDNEVGHMLNCSAHGMPEQYTYKLTHSSLFSGLIIRQLNYTSISTGFIVHQFTNLSYMDTGIYTCSVNNGIRDYRDGSLDKSVSTPVWIKGAPYLTANDLIFQAEKGQSGRLLVEFYSSLLGAHVVWLRHMTEIRNSYKYNMSVSNTNVSVKFYSVFVQQPGLIATLEIRNVTEEDFTFYAIHVQNDVGEMYPVTLELRPKEQGQYRTGNQVDVVIIGTVIGAVLLLTLAVAFVAVLLCRRRRIPNLKSEGLSVNPVYDSTGSVPESPINSGATMTGAEYAEVVKPDKRAPKEKNSSDVYAQVDKQTKHWKKGTEKAKHGSSSEVDSYENAAVVGISSKHEHLFENSRKSMSEPCDESFYEDSRIAASKGSLMNKDGLLYADLMLDPPTTKTGIHAIQGIENCTDYAEIDYGKRGEPLHGHANEKSDTPGSINH